MQEQYDKKIIAVKEKEGDSSNGNQAYDKLGAT
jgi:hypothetical protein